MDYDRQAGRDQMTDEERFFEEFHEAVEYHRQKLLTTGEPMKVYAAINKVQAALAREGIGKDRKNQQQGYSFRGIDDVYNALAPVLAANGLCILPRMLSRECVERQSAKGGALFYVTVEAEFDLVCAEDGSKHTIRTYGEAMDSGDKATNKAMSAAYKYAAMQAFAIPTEGDNDADAQTHEVAPADAHHRLSESQRADFLAAIDAASDKDSLRKAKDLARDACTVIQDAASWSVIKAAVEARMKALGVST